jgi:hypothetical protein
MNQYIKSYIKGSGKRMHNSKHDELKEEEQSR